jgi:hypothetical protein
MRILLVLLAVAPLVVSGSDQLIPTTDGTTWLYELTEEAGAKFAFAPGTADRDGKIHRLAAYRISSIENLDGQRLLKFEMHRDGVVTNTDLMTVDERGILCAGRISEYGELTRLDPPQPIVVAPLTTAAKWEFRMKIGDRDVQQQSAVLAEEDVDVPAGKFHAFHIHSQQSDPVPMTIDRWFANGVGIVQDITVTKTVDGNLLRRITLRLKELPKIAPRPAVKPVPRPKKLSVSVGTNPVGGATNQFGTTAPKIYVRWEGHGLRAGAKIRAVWIAESVRGTAPPEQTLDEATTIANSADAHGVFALSRPDAGWAPGEYRVDVYLDAQLADSAKLKIAD